MNTVEDFTYVFESHRAQLRGFILRLTTNVADADDIVQDTYIKAHEHLAGFEHNWVH
jgi:RNA polymerase sigma-70 factor, ECF subfamily